MNAETIARQIEANSAEWKALHRSGIDKRTRAYKQERNRISDASYTLSQRYAAVTGMDFYDVIVKFGLISTDPL